MKTLHEVPSLRTTRFTLEDPMTGKRRVSIKLTQQQQQELAHATGKRGEAIELDVEELEERIAPSFISTSLADPRPSPGLEMSWVSFR